MVPGRRRALAVYDPGDDDPLPRPHQTQSGGGDDTEAPQVLAQEPGRVSPTDTPVDHRSATASSRASMPGQAGGVGPGDVPARRSGEDWATAPACGRLPPGEPEARLEAWRGRQGLEVGRVSAGTRRRKSSIEG